MCIIISILRGERLTELYDDLFLLGNIALKAKLEAKSLKKSMFFYPMPETKDFAKTLAWRI